MITPPFFAHIPAPAYLFRISCDDFVLEDVNLVAIRLNPMMSTLRGKKLARLYQDQPQVVEDARRCIADGQPVVREMPVRRHDRTEATSTLRITYVFAPPEHLVLFTEDLSSPAMAESAARESEARYRSLIAALPGAMLLRGADGRILACNDIAVRLFGATHQADLLGQRGCLMAGHRLVSDAGELLADDALPGLRVLATGRAEAGVMLGLETPAGKRWLLAASQPVLSAAGAVTGAVTSFTDLTDLIKAQDEIRQGAARLDLALSAARMGVWEFSPGTDRGWWSDNLNEIFQYPPSADGIAPFLEHVHPDDRANLLAASGALSQEGDLTTFEREFRILGKDGVTRWARLRGRISRADSQVSMVGTIMDVTEHHRLEEELRRAHRLESLGQLAGGVAHDFNNLLAAMMGSLELLEGVCPPAGREDLATIRDGAVRARDLTRQLLAFAKQQPLEFKTVDLMILVAQVERLLRRLVGPTVEIVIAAAGAAPLFVRADASLLEQVLVNLVVNARDAMPQGGRILLAVGEHPRSADVTLPPGELIALSVTDTGAGMDAETRSRAFDPFFSTKAHGIGLGLASSYGIVRQHGGDILVDSRLGMGTRFDVVLPRVQGVATIDAPVAVPRPAGRGCVLVIDDEELVRNTTVRVLRSLHYDVLAAGTAEAALAHATSHAGRIDVLVCDVAMPDRDGPSLAAELRQLRPELAIVFVSGYAEVPSEALLPDARFLQKPYTRAQLAAILEDMLAMVAPKQG